MARLRILICDDHAVVRAGLRLILDPEADLEIVGEAETAQDAIAQAGLLKPDLVILDISMPGANGLDAMAQLRAVAPDARILILTVHADEAYFFHALAAGADGYVLKGASVVELLSAIRFVIHGGIAIPRTLGPRLLKDYLDQVQNGSAAGYDQLSAREREIVRLVARGRTNKEIAEQLSLSVRTVERHRSSIMNKVGLQNRAELVAYAVRRGFLSGEDNE